MEENIHNNDQQLNNTSANTAVMVDSLVDLIAAQELLRKEKEEAAEKARLQAIAEKEAREKEAKAKADAIALATKADQEATTSEVLPEVIQAAVPAFRLILRLCRLTGFSLCPLSRHSQHRTRLV